MGEFIPFGGMLLTGILGFLGYRVAMYRLRQQDEARAGGSPDLADEVARLRDEVARLRDVHDRVLELEERLDFTERVLAREREQPRLPDEAG